MVGTRWQEHQYLQAETSWRQYAKHRNWAVKLQRAAWRLELALVKGERTSKILQYQKADWLGQENVFQIVEDPTVKRDLRVSDHHTSETLDNLLVPALQNGIRGLCKRNRNSNLLIGLAPNIPSAPVSCVLTISSSKTAKNSLVGER